MRGLYYLIRWLRIESALDSKQPVFGARSMHRGLSTWLMVFGVLIGVLGLAWFEFWAAVIGAILFAAGLAFAIVGSIIAEIRHED